MSHSLRLSKLEKTHRARELAELDGFLRQYAPGDLAALIITCRRIQAGESIPPPEQQQFALLWRAYSRFSVQAREAHAGRYHCLSGDTRAKVENFIKRSLYV